MENFSMSKKSSFADTQVIYIVISQTGTIVSQILQIITKDKYNHVSISLNRELTQMYSFGRLHAYFPLPGGFINESIHEKLFACHPNTELLVIEVPVSKKQKERITALLTNMENNRQMYSYNLIGLLLAGVKYAIKSHNKYY